MPGIGIKMTDWRDRRIHRFWSVLYWTIQFFKANFDSYPHGNPLPTQASCWLHPSPSCPCLLPFEWGHLENQWSKWAGYLGWLQSHLSGTCTCTCTCVRVCVYVSMCVCMYVWMDGWMDGWMHACMYLLYVCMYVCMYVCICNVM